VGHGRAVEVRCGQVCSGFAWFGQLRRSCFGALWCGKSGMLGLGTAVMVRFGPLSFGVFRHGGRGEIRLGLSRFVAVC
jgi:hypothetical protein